MKAIIKFIKIAAGFVLLFFLVVQPLRSSALISIALHYQLPIESQIILASHAVELDPCEIEAIDFLGDQYTKLKNYTMAAFEYGKGMICSPGNALMRIKFGETLMAMGFEGLNHIDDALKLEPNNPIFQNEYSRISQQLQLRSQSQ